MFAIHSAKRCRGWYGAKTSTCAHIARVAKCEGKGAQRVQRGERTVNAFVVRARSLIFAPRYFLLRTRRYTYRTCRSLRSDVNLSTRSQLPVPNDYATVSYGEVVNTGVFGYANHPIIISSQFEQIIRWTDLLKIHKEFKIVLFKLFPKDSRLILQRTAIVFLDNFDFSKNEQFEHWRAKERLFIEIYFVRRSWKNGTLYFILSIYYRWWEIIDSSLVCSSQYQKQKNMTVTENILKKDMRLLKKNTVPRICTACGISIGDQ